MSEFFATNTPDPPHWILNTCFGAFLTICVHLGPLGCLTKLGAKTFRISAKVRATRSRRSFSRRTHPIHPIGSHVLVGFIPFGCIWDRLVALRNSVQNGPNYCKSSCHEVASEFFAMNTPDPPHWTLNYHFAAFRTIWLHLGLFWLPYETQCKTGRTSAKVCVTKLLWNFSPRAHPIYPTRP